MVNISEERRRIVGVIAGIFLLVGLIGIVLTMGGRHGTSATILELTGLGQYETTVYLSSLFSLVVAFSLGYVVRQNKSDDERRGLE